MTHRIDPKTFGETPPNRSLAGIGKGACAQVGRCENIGRAEWIKQHARGRVLDIGGNEGSGWTVPLPPGWAAMRKHAQLKDGRMVSYDVPAAIRDITVFDCDMWIGLFPLVRGDAHALPFRDEAFDTVVLGDILEHVEDDYKVLAEAVRVARLQVIGTTPDEYGWDQSLQPFKPIHEWIDEKGGDYEKLMREETTDLRTDYATCHDYVDDRDLPHLHHVRWYDFDKVTRLLDSTHRRYELSHIHYHGNPPQFTNFACVVEK